MKKLTLTLALAALGQSLFAQDYAANRRADIPVVQSAATETDAAAPAGTFIIAKPDAKLVAKLANLFPAATAQTWRLFNGCYHVSFVFNGQKARAVFTPKAKLNYALLSCNEAALPASLKAAIDNEYASYQLISAVQINAYNATAHQALLENGTELVTLKATVDGVEVVSRVKK